MRQRARHLVPLLASLAATVLAPLAPAPPAAAADDPAAAHAHGEPAGPHVVTPMELPEEKHLANVRMLTTTGENAEAYWSWNGKRLVYQARRGEEQCDRIRTMKPDGSSDRLVADKGAHTCAFYLPGDRRIIWSSTMGAGPECPPKPDYSMGYVWALHDSFDIYSSWPDGTGVRQLTHTPGYDAEATVAPDGTIVFFFNDTATTEIYTMDSDGRNVRRLTFEPGYDGGPFFSPDGSLIAFRAEHPRTPEQLADFRALLAKGLVRPSHLDLWVMNRDGSNKRRVTDLPGASFAPSFVPGNRAVIFSSNHEDPQGRNFDLYLVNLDGTGLQRVTWNDTFDGFPMFSPDGRQLVFCSNRANRAPHETNVFVADWVP